MNLIFAFYECLAMVFDKMGIDTNEVVTNEPQVMHLFPSRSFGGHCKVWIPTTSLTKPKNFGYHSQIILNGDR